jgi:ankyrin repeat protein
VHEDGQRTSIPGPAPALALDGPTRLSAELLAAVKAGTASQVADLLEQGADPFATDTAAWSSIHIAAWRRRSDVLQVLVDYVSKTSCRCVGDCVADAVECSVAGDVLSMASGSSSGATDGDRRGALCMCARQGAGACPKALLLQRGAGGNCSLHLSCTPHPLVSPAVLGMALCTTILCKVSPRAANSIAVFWGRLLPTQSQRDPSYLCVSLGCMWQAFVAQGLRLDIANEDGAPALLMAVANGFASSASVLIEEMV